MPAPEDIPAPVSKATERHSAEPRNLATPARSREASRGIRVCGALAPRRHDGANLQTWRRRSALRCERHDGAKVRFRPLLARHDHMLRGAKTSQSTPLKLLSRPSSCIRTSASNLQGRLPVLRRAGERPEWDVYLRSVYGDGLITYPVDLSTFSWFYTNKLPLNGVQPDQLGNECAPRHLHAWRGALGYSGFDLHSAGFWVQQSISSRPGAALPNQSLAEVMRATPPAWSHLDEQYGTWFWEARGSGIWLFLGRTLALTRPERNWPAALLVEPPNLRVKRMHQNVSEVQRMHTHLREVDTVQCPDSAVVFGSVMPNRRFEIVVLPTRDSDDVITGGLPGEPPTKCHIAYRTGWDHSRGCRCEEAAPFLRCIR